MNLTIGLAFGMNNFANVPNNSQNHDWVASRFDFDSCIEKLETKSKIHSLNVRSDVNRSLKQTKSISIIKSN